MLSSPRVSSQVEIRQKFRMRVERRDALLLPGAANALTARIIEDLGFEAVYLTGAGLANTHLGMPDLGLVSVTELAETAARISDVCRLLPYRRHRYGIWQRPKCISNGTATRTGRRRRLAD